MDSSDEVFRAVKRTPHPRQRYHCIFVPSCLCLTPVSSLSTMPARTWTDKPRRVFLESKIPAYQAAQENKQPRLFMQNLHEEYFTLFPEPDELLQGAERKVCCLRFRLHCLLY